MSLFHVAYNGYVWKALFLYRHPDRSGGIFLAHRYSVLCVTAGKGNPSVKGARKSRVQGRFLAAPLMTVWGNGFISRSEQRICLESAIPVLSSRAKPSIFPAHWYIALCEIAEKGKPFAKGARNDGVQGRFLDCARNDGMVYIALCEIAEKGNPFAKGARKNKVQGRFLAALEMTVWGGWVYFT